MKFNCSHCGQEIECDELWSGHEIQCPTCQKPLMVPPKPDAPPQASLASAKAGQPRLSIGQSQAQHATAPKAIAPQVTALEAKLNQDRQRQGGGAMKWVTIGVVVIALGVGSYLGYPYVREALAKRNEAAKQPGNSATQDVAAAAAPDSAPGAPPAPPREKELPVLPPMWTLDVEKASIPKSKLNGAISGTNFLATTARLDKVGPAYLLRLLQGTTASPDLGFMVYLHPAAGESITGQTWTVSHDMKGRTVPQVVKLWKTDPRYQARQKSFSSGYAMKLELGDVTNGVIAGKIFLAVPPETEQTVIAGAFKAETTIGDANAATAANPTAAPSPAPAPAPGDASALQRRYGTK